MTSDDDAGKPDAPMRHVYGPRQLSALLPPLVRPAFRRRAPATAQVLADWEAIVGPAIAAIATPLRLSAGTLTVACAGPVAMELQHVSTALIGRINTHLGSIVVQRLKLVQSMLPALSAAAPPPAVPRLARPQADAATQAALGDFPPGELRAALERLGRAALAPRVRP